MGAARLERVNKARRPIPSPRVEEVIFFIGVLILIPSSCGRSCKNLSDPAKKSQESPRRSGIL
jgi:hypothetical protein